MRRGDPRSVRDFLFLLVVAVALALVFLVVYFAL